MSIHWTVRAFLLAFVLNFIWEHLHAALYLSYRGGNITDAILLHATLVDAGAVTTLALCSVYIARRQEWIVPLGVAAAVATEWWALGTGRWVYDATMPVIPLLGVGLSPAVQLAVTGYIAVRLVR